MQKVRPRETRAPRMRPLAVLPIFLDLAGKRVVVAGAGDATVWKAELVAAAGAHVEVFTRDPCVELVELSSTPPAGRIAVGHRRWRADDLAGAALAIGALAGEEAQSFAAAAGAHGVPVNIVDTPELSTFSFGSIVNRSPVVVGVSTDGAAPVLGQAIRAKIEALLHPALGAWTAAARAVRTRVNTQCPWGRHAATCGVGLRTGRSLPALRQPSRTCEDLPSPTRGNAARSPSSAPGREIRSC